MEPLNALADYLRSLPPQRLVLRAVDENRPTQAEAAVVVGMVRYVEVVTVANRVREARRFEGVSAESARALAASVGHTVLAKNGNIT